jgi:hypothetical protein
MTSPYVDSVFSPIALTGSDLTPAIAATRLSAAGIPFDGSPLFGAGVNIGTQRDITGKQRPNPPSIGAYDRARMSRRT